MFEHFGDYMFYLLHAPLRKLKAGENQLKIFFSVVGEVFDGIPISLRIRCGSRR